MLHPLDNCAATIPARFFVELQEGDDLRMFCAKTNLSPRDNTGMERAPRRCNSARRRVFQYVDRLELDRTDREKLLESQAAGSARLPERSMRGLGHHRIPCRGWLPSVNCSAVAVNPGRRSNGAANP